MILFCAESDYRRWRDILVRHQVLPRLWAAVLFWLIYQAITTTGPLVEAWTRGRIMRHETQQIERVLIWIAAGVCGRWIARPPRLRVG